VPLVLERGANPNAVSKQKWYSTPVSDAVKTASLATINLLLQYHGSVEQGQLLHHAVQRPSEGDRLQIVALILSKNPPINEVQFQSIPGIYAMYQAFDLGTPIYYAARTGHLDVVQLLGENGADQNIVSSRGRLPVDVAESRGYTDIVSYLRSRPGFGEQSSTHFVDSHQ
jgi:hypothetical protein